MQEHKISKTSKKVQREKVSRFRDIFMQWGAFVIVLYILCILLSQRFAWDRSHIHIDQPKTIQFDELQKGVALAQEKYFLFLIRRDNNLLYPKKYITKRLMQDFPRIASLDIQKDWKGIQYRMIERHPAYLACSMNTEKLLDACWYMDATGMVFDEAPIFSLGVYTLFLLDTPPTALPYRPFHSELLNQLDLFRLGIIQRYGGTIESVEITAHDVIVHIVSLFDQEVPLGSYILLDNNELTTTTGANAVFGRLDLARDKGPFLEKLQSSAMQFKYLDMRFPDKFYFKFHE